MMSHGDDPYGERRRESLIDRRLRVARGEESDEYDERDGGDTGDAGDGRYGRYERPPIPAIAMAGGGGCAQTTLYIVIGALVLVMVGLLVGRQVLNNMVKNVTEGVPERVLQVVATPTPTIRDRGGTILQIQALNRIETLQYSVERVVEAGTERGDFLDSLLGDKLLLIASGDVVVGVDLSRLRASDVNISSDGDSITIRLPPSEIFRASLNNDRTRVYNRDTKVLTQLTGGQDPTLETQARQAAEDEILKAACEGNVMQRAADEAKRSMEQFLSLLQFKSITVISEAGQCVAPSAAQNTP